LTFIPSTNKPQSRPIVNEDNNTYLQNKAPKKALPKIQEIETL
jgi:hypothetical protein